MNGKREKRAISKSEENENPYKIKPYKFTTKKKKEFLRLIREDGLPGMVIFAPRPAKTAGQKP